MEYILSFLLLGLNLFDYEYNVNSAVFFMLGAALVFGLFVVCFKKTKDVMCTCVMMMCHTWQISWINIFGDSTENLQLPWFYIIGVVILLWALSRLTKLKDRPVNAVMLGLFVTLCLISVYPLLISNSITEGLKEFIMIMFFVILVFVAFLFSKTINAEQREHIINAYIYAVVLTSCFLIVQYVSYSVFNTVLFKFSIGVYTGEVMTSAKLLMEDASCATIMLGTGTIFMLERINENKYRLLNILFILITVVGLGVTSRRTSIISLVICFVLYVPFRYKGIMKKLSMMLLLAGISSLMLVYFTVVRPTDDYTMYLDSNGRIENYLQSLELFYKHPLGIGYDNVELLNRLGDFVPHNIILRWMNMAGIVFTVLMLTVFIYILITAFKKDLKAEFWALLYSMIAMNFIPDIFNARFFVIPCMMTLISVSMKEEVKESKSAKLPILKKLNQQS